jgi:hypothetical protein
LPVESIAEAISFFAADCSAYEQAARQAREAAKKFDIDEIVGRNQEVCLSVLAGNGAWSTRGT